MNQVRNTVIFGLLVLVIILLARECNSMYKVKENKIDTIVQRVYVNETKYKKQLDSMMIVDEQKELEKYRLKVELSDALRQLSASQKQAVKLAGNIAVARVKYDTILYIASCDSLSVEVGELNNTIDVYKEINRQLSETYDSQIAIRDSQIALQQDMYSGLRKGFDEVVAHQKYTHEQLNKALKKNSKKYNVSIGVGAALTPEFKIAPVVALTVNKTIFKF